jgi:hypothetical protein
MPNVIPATDGDVYDVAHFRSLPIYARLARLFDQDSYSDSSRSTSPHEPTLMGALAPIQNSFQIIAEKVRSSRKQLGRSKSTHIAAI